MAGRAAHRATLAARPAQAVLPLLCRLLHPASVTALRANGARQLRLCRSHTLYLVRVLIFRGASMMIALEARAPALNRLRSWTLAADQDLFGRWQAVVTLGRIERHDQARRHAFEDEASLSRFVRRALLRCGSATRRIGVSYEVVEASPSVLALLTQLGLAVRLPPAPKSGRGASEPLGAVPTPSGLHPPGRRYWRFTSASGRSSASRVAERRDREQPRRRGPRGPGDAVAPRPRCGRRPGRTARRE